MLRRFLLVVAAGGILSAADSTEFFERKVRPVLAKNCYSCHTASKMGGLAVDSRDGLMKGGARGPAVTPGDPDRSLLIRAIRYVDPALKMPPAGRMADSEIADLSSWIRAGAPWPERSPAPASAGAGYTITPEQRAWWAFQPVRKPSPPAVKNTRWPRGAIDRFILDRIERAALSPAPEAGKRVLLRRAYLDLIGLPPTPEQTEAFLKDNSGDAFERVVDGLLASPRYGERWGRYWLDLARYSDDRLNSTQDEPYANAYRYRDWVIQAFNDDMPYDLFLKAQIAGDQVDPARREKLIAGLGFYALSPEFQDDRVDVTTRSLLGLTVACAQCHDHKFDPIPTKDYYALLGVFTSSVTAEHPLAPEAVVNAYKARKEAVEAAEKEIADFLEKQATQLAEILAADTARYLLAARQTIEGRKPDAAGLDTETVERWVRYLKEPVREHPFLDGWQQETFPADRFQQLVRDVLAEKKKIDDTNFIRLGGSNARRDLASADLLSLPRDRYFLWRDLFSRDKVGKADSGIYYYRDGQIDRFLGGFWKQHLDALRANLEARKKAVPEQYPFFHVLRDSPKPANQRVMIRGSRDNLGEEAPRAFLSVLSPGRPKPFEKGSGRLELAEAIASPDNPLTARVFVNRVWQHHFGRPLVGTPSNFGQLGEKPSHPELLDYLAARFMENGWSLKKLHREIMLSAVYRLSAEHNGRNEAADPDNKLFWRANRRRLDIEPLRDTLLFVTGELDHRSGGPAAKLTDPANLRRTVYGFVSRRKLDGTLSLFDFPNPNSTSEQRIPTATPLQQLFFLNSEFLERRAGALAARLARAAADDAGRIREAYRLLYGRAPLPAEVALALSYLKGEKDGWKRYAQVLLSSNELVFVN